MIKNDRAYKVTKAAADRFAAALVSDEGMPLQEGKSEIARAAELSSLRAQLADLREQIAEYERLRSGGIHELVADRIEDLPVMLIRARIAQKLTHAQLADLVDSTAQQIQRWEEDDYESASFWRLADVAGALGLSFRVEARLAEASVPDVDVVADKLKKMGLDKAFIERSLVPQVEEMCDEKDMARLFGCRIEAIYGQPLPDLMAANDIQPWTVRRTANTRFKVPAKASEASVGLFATYAHFLTASLCKALGDGRSHPLPQDWKGMREWLFAGGQPDLGTAASRLWEAGIPVLPLSSRSGPHGACWRIAGRGAIALKQPVRTTSRWLFDLVHELSHLVEAGDVEEFEMLEGEATADDRRLSEEEARAHAFAADVLLEGRSEAIYRLVMADAGDQPARIKGAIARVAETEGVKVGLLAEHVAFRFGLETGGNIWGAARNLQKEPSEPFVIVHDTLLARVDLTDVPEPAAGLLKQAFSQGLS